MARVVGVSGRMTVSVDDDGTVRLTETGKASGGYYMPPEYALELAVLLERAARSDDAMNQGRLPKGHLPTA